MCRFGLTPCRIAWPVEQAEADLRVAAGALDTRRRAIATEKANAVIAREQIKRAQSNFELATRTAERLGPLAGKAYVSSQQFDQAQTAQTHQDLPQNPPAAAHPATDACQEQRRQKQR